MKLAAIYNHPNSTGEHLLFEYTTIGPIKTNKQDLINDVVETLTASQPRYNAEAIAGARGHSSPHKDRSIVCFLKWRRIIVHVFLEF